MSDRRDPVSPSLLLGLVIALLGADPAVGQTSPAGFGVSEGSSRFLLVGNGQRFQQIDATQIGMPRQVNGIAFRQDVLGTPMADGVGPRTMDVRVRLDVVSMSRLVHGFDDNFVAPVEVFPRQQVVLPDWSSPMQGFTAPFDFVIDFTTPFSYSGAGALLIDIDWQNPSSLQPVWFDAIEEEYRVADPVFFGSGCRGDASAFPPVLTFLIGSGGLGMQAFGMRLIPRIQAAIPLAPVFLCLDVQDRALDAPGLCGTLHVDAALALYIGDTDAAGLLDYQHLSFPYGVGIEGVEIIAQALQPDLTSSLPIPWALTNPARSVMPFVNTTVTPACAWHVADVPVNPDNAYSEVFFGGGLVIELR